MNPLSREIEIKFVKSISLLMSWDNIPGLASYEARGEVNLKTQTKNTWFGISHIFGGLSVLLFSVLQLELGKGYC